MEDATPRPQDWQWAEWALKQAEKESRREEQVKSSFTESFYKWRFAYNSFRKAENELMFDAKPDATDFAIHKHLGTNLAAIGMELDVVSQEFEPMFLDDIGFSRNIVREMVKALEDTLEAFHSSKNKKRIAELESRIFSGKTVASS